jgi:hypothetical protein
MLCTVNTIPKMLGASRETYVDRMVQAHKDFTEKRRFPQHVQQVEQVVSVPS